MKLPWYTSWLIIIIAFALSTLYPALGLLGLALLSIRVAKERKISYTAGNTMRGFGNLFIFGFLIMLAYGSSEGDSDLMAASLVFLIIGLIIRGIGKRSVMKGQKYAQYMDVVYNRQVRSIHQIAGMMNRTPNVVQSDIQSMIRRKLMPGASINNAIITIPHGTAPTSITTPHVQAVDQGSQATANSGQYPPRPQAQQQQAPQAPTPQAVVKSEPVIRPPKVVACRGCGATTTIRDGQEVECEFCGSLLTYDM